MKLTLGALFLVAQATTVFTATLGTNFKNGSDLTLEKREDCPYVGKFGCDNGWCWGPCGSGPGQGRGGWAWLQSWKTLEWAKCTNENYMAECDIAALQIPEGADKDYGTGDQSCHC
ncbi:hypothetical protein N7481_003316 [Penicillium waksmanii]|uniref:uncharacterized protein n=1 Tax=Penicillium waksmanii TaxID=69791 RepID=UPI0025490A9D|nr:uncharacterized protein N7481_003316 [Penicillium waksmanii]KAJ5988106.1 hypothetical protein N7481_003316 [Penicillium waksmanii]